MTTNKFKHCHVDSSTGLMWCQFQNGTWAPPFTVSNHDSGYVKTPSLIEAEDEVDTNIQE